MMKTILLTGATDGIGYETAKLLAREGHRLLLHGRSAEKLARLKESLGAQADVDTYRADLSRLSEVRELAAAITQSVSTLDVLINNAGVYATAHPITPEGFDVRFIVNTIAPYVLTESLLALMPATGRVINLSSAAQAPVDVGALLGKRALSQGDAYAQSKLAITMWSYHMARERGAGGPAVIAVNPGSLLGTKMVRDAYGTSGKDLAIGANILHRAALSDEFGDASGRYFDNDRGAFGRAHPDADDPAKHRALIGAMKQVIGAFDGQDASA
ncbi:MAG: SDR family NAD(P)-dependent oxidoreductase [Pseudomonadota bacterium]